MVNTESLGRIGSADPVLVSDEAADASSRSALRPVAHQSKASRLRKINDAYVMVEQALNPWQADLSSHDDVQWLWREASILRGMVARDRTRFYRTGSYRAAQAA